MQSPLRFVLKPPCYYFQNLNQIYPVFMLPGAFTNAASAKCIESHPGGYSPCLFCIASCLALSQVLGKVGSTLLCPSSAFLSADVLLLCREGQGIGEDVLRHELSHSERSPVARRGGGGQGPR